MTRTLLFEHELRDRIAAACAEQGCKDCRPLLLKLPLGEGRNGSNWDLEKLPNNNSIGCDAVLCDVADRLAADYVVSWPAMSEH